MTLTSLQAKAEVERVGRDLLLSAGDVSGASSHLFNDVHEMELKGFYRISKLKKTGQKLENRRNLNKSGPGLMFMGFWGWEGWEIFLELIPNFFRDI